jgi:hypothetical protein
VLGLIASACPAKPANPALPRAIKMCLRNLFDEGAFAIKVSCCGDQEVDRDCVYAISRPVF